jgi:hypothetical protein
LKTPARAGIRLPSQNNGVADLSREDVIISYGHNQAGAEATAAFVRAKGRRAWLLPLDLEKAKALQDPARWYPQDFEVILNRNAGRMNFALHLFSSSNHLFFIRCEKDRRVGAA